MSIFNRADRATISARIKDTEAQIAQAEAALLAIVMQSVPDDANADQAAAKLQAFQNKRSMLDKALVAAEQDEADQRTQAQKRADESRRRATRQHQSRLVKEARAVSELLAQLVVAQERFEQTGATLLANTQNSGLEMRLSPSALARYSQIEGWRLQTEGKEPAPLGTRNVHLFDYQKGTRSLGADGPIATLAQRITDLTSTITHKPSGNSTVEAVRLPPASVVEHPPTPTDLFLRQREIDTRPPSDVTVLDTRTNKGEAE